MKSARYLILVIYLLGIPSDLLFSQATNTWQPTNGPYGGGVGRFAVHPTSPNHIVISARNGLHRTTNGGATWTKIQSTPSFFDIRIAPTSVASYYVSSVGGVFKSSNGGNSWERVLADRTRAIEVDPTNPLRVIVGSYDSGRVFETTDGGVSWRTIAVGNVYGGVSVIAIAKTNPQVICVGSRGTPDFPGAGVFVSTDGGNSWRTDSSRVSVNALIIDPTNQLNIYAGTNGNYFYSGSGIFKSTNSGLSWFEINNGLPPEATIGSTIINPRNTLHLITIASNYDSGAVYESTNGGLLWRRFESNPPVAGLFVTTQSVPYPLFVGTGIGLFEGTFDTRNFELVGRVETPSIRSMDASNGIVYVAGEQAYRTTNSGILWEEIGGGDTVRIFEVVRVSKSDPSIVYGDKFKSTNAGTTWMMVAPALVRAIDPTNPNIVFAGGLLTLQGTAVARTTNGGVSWDTLRFTTDTAGVLSLAIDPINTATVYVGTQNKGIYKSTNRGSTWVPINNGLPEPRQFFGYIFDIIVDPSNPNVLYAGLYLGGVYKSTNGGNNWFASDVGITGLDIRSLCLDLQNLNKIYAGAYRWGVFQSTDAGASWSRLGTGLDSIRVSAITFGGMNSRTLFASSYDGGVWSYTFEPTNVEEFSKTIPQVFNLHQNYPNPFNPETNISFDLPKNSFVTLKIFNLIGQEVATIVNAQLEAGTHTYRVSGEKFGMSSGVYLYRMQAEKFVATKKLVLLK